MPGRGRWCWDLAQLFLIALANSGNVREAARVSGYTTPTLYWRRLRYPLFAAAWDLARAEGNARALALYLAQLTRSSESDYYEVTADVTVVQGLHQLGLHRYSLGRGKPQRYNHNAKPPDMAKMRANILRDIEAMETVERWRKVKGFDV